MCWFVISFFFLFFFVYEREGVIICDSPWESREKGERTGTRAMTRHAKRVNSLSDMRICNKQNKECHGRYCFACSSFCPKQ